MNNNYIKQLDSIRAIAVLLVIITHWFPESHMLNIYTSVFNGVDIFFVLSGFLITRILLENRIQAEKTGTNKINVIKFFFARRFLRIFPIYYLIIFTLYIVGYRTGTDIKSNFLYFLTYSSNFYFFKRQSWDGMLSHLWSLSVEEQFYLIWPWFMLFLNKKALLPFIVISVLIGVMAQFFLMNVMFGDILTFSCFDGFGIGASLAWISTFKFSSLKKIYPVLILMAVVSFALQVMRVAGFIQFPSRILTSICTIYVITGITLYGEKKSFFFNTFLKNGALVFIGKISYGIYLYHLILPYYTTNTFNKLNKHLPFNFYRHNFYLIHLENFFLLILICYLSWKIIEEPILKLKIYFGYQKPNHFQPSHLVD